MDKWDRLSWWAAGIFVAGIVLGLTVHFTFLLLMAVSLMLRSSLHAFGVARRHADERQLHIQYHSGNIALTVVILMLIAFAVHAGVQGRDVGEHVTTIIVALAAKGLVGLIMTGDLRAAGLRIALTLGVAIVLFASLEGAPSVGTLVEAAPGIVILLTALAALRWPRIAAVLFAAYGITLFIIFGPVLRPGFSTALTGLILSVPLLAAAWCFLRSASGGADDDAPVPDHAGKAATRD